MTILTFKPGNVAVRVLVVVFLLALTLPSAQPRQKDSKKDDKKKIVEPFKIERLTQAMGLYAIGAISPDRKSILLLANKPNEAPNIYTMTVADHAIRPPVTSFKLGATDACWSPDGKAIAFAAYIASASFPELFLLDLASGKQRQLTSNQFSDKEPVFTPDGKRILFTSDESPLPDAAFGTLHIAVVNTSSGKPQAFPDDEGATIKPGISIDGKSVLLISVNEQTGRHSLLQYGFDGKQQRDLTERKFARIHNYINNPPRGSIVLWAQEEPEQHDDVYVLDLKTGEAKPLPDPDMVKKNPTVSPDGSLIAFISPTDIGDHVFVFDSATGEIKQITARPSNDHSPVFVSDHEILFGSDRDKEKEIYLVDLTQPAETKKSEEKKKGEEKKK